MPGKKFHQLKPEEAKELRKKVQVGALLVIRLKMSQKEAARIIGTPSASFNRYLRDGLPDGELWPEDQKPDISLENQYNQYAEEWKKQHDPAKNWANGRDEVGKYLPGHPPESVNRLAIQARANLEKLLPKAVKKFSSALNALSPQQDPVLTIQCCNTLFDRILGKAKQSVDINANTQTWETYGWIGDVIQAGDEQSIRLAAQLAAAMESYARDDGLSFKPRQVEIIPPPDGAVDSIDPGGSGQDTEADNQHATPAWEE